VKPRIEAAAVPTGPRGGRWAGALAAAAKRANRSKYLYLLFLLPFAYYFIFHYVPMYGILISFQKYNIVKGIAGSKWVGLAHFQKFLADPYFWKLVRNTLLLNLYNLFWGFPAPVILALLLNELKGGSSRGSSRASATCPTSSPPSSCAG
jgi:ABC-type polysaccharide transport system permease subunit